MIDTIDILDKMILDRLIDILIDTRDVFLAMGKLRWGKTENQGWVSLGPEV